MDDCESLESRAIESILQVALDTEALFTIFLGQPFWCHFTWAPEDELISELEQTSDGNLDEWLASLLSDYPLHRPFLPWYNESIAKAWRNLKGCQLQPFVIRNVVESQHSPLWERDSKEEKKITLYCISLEAMHKQGIDLSFPSWCSSGDDLLSGVVKFWFETHCNMLQAVLSKTRNKGYMMILSTGLRVL